jgi:protein-S-isoprenylcysteine O-methyltransferase Ste14
MTVMFHILLIFLAFALIHSITISRWFKDLCKAVFGLTFMQAWYRFLFTLLSVVTVMIAFPMMHRVPDHAIWTAPDVLRWPMHGLRTAAILFGVMAFRHLDGREFLGVKQVWRYLTRREVGGNIEGLTQKELVTKGVYGIVRHPLYVAGIVIFTVNPHVTVNGLTVTVLADFYFLFGMFIEERRFLRIFGDQYRAYMQRVPRLVPRVVNRRSYR